MDAARVDPVLHGRTGPLIHRYIAGLPDSFTTARPLYRTEDGRVAARFFNCQLTSAFQPIFDLPRGAVIGHQGLLRILGSGDGPTLTPWNLFALASTDSILQNLDRLCRTVHALNYFQHAHPDQLLFLNVEQRLLASVPLLPGVPDAHGRVFESILAEFRVTPRRVVIEFPRSVLSDPWLLERAARNYRSRGYRVAVPTNSWDEDALRLFDGGAADILKVDVTPGVARRRLEGFTSGLHERGILVLARRVESSELLELVREAGVDLVQGFHVGHPQPVVSGQRCLRGPVTARTPAGFVAGALRLGSRPEVYGR